jgi:chemosensory pili system protein ChpA (sensor histidine kinase/response regulator)
VACIPAEKAIVRQRQQLMDDDIQSSQDDQELSAEDLEILRLFEEKSDWSQKESEQASAQDTASAPLPASPAPVEEGSQAWLYTTFIPEATEDIARMQRALARLEREAQVQPSQFALFKRAGHKIRGAAGMVDCQGIAAIAQYIEETAEQIVNKVIAPGPARAVFAQAVAALEMGVQNLGRSGTEGQLPLTELSALFLHLPSASNAKTSARNVSTSGADERVETSLTGEKAPVERSSLREESPVRTPSQQLAPLEHSPLQEESSVRTSSRSKFVSYTRVDERRVEQLIQYSEQTTSLQAAVESAQEQFQTALQELRAAQARLRRIQPQLSSLLSDELPMSGASDQASSSLVARILNFPPSYSSTRGEGATRSRAGRYPPDGTQWDELDMERYNEKDMLIRSLTEAIADITLASVRVDEASSRLIERQQEYISHMHDFRNQALLLRLAPLKSLVSRLQHTVSTCALGYAQQIAFDVSGEETEVDQGILDFLTPPLVQLVRTCMSDVAEILEEEHQPPHVWLSANHAGNEIMLEIGFSMSVQGGALECIREPLCSLNGTYSLGRNAAGGVSFLLRFPRSRGVTRFLVVRVSSQYLLIPFYQIERIVEQLPSSTVYHLGDLLGFPHQFMGEARVQPVVMLSQHIAEGHAMGVIVDEVVGEAESEVRPLEPYLQRPGISGAVIDGHGNAMLVVDLPELVRHYTLQPYTTASSIGTSAGASRAPAASSTQDAASNTILVADDSVSLRRSLCRMLRSEHYTVMEARDGLEALELLQKHLPGLCLLDIEMPNLNGFDLLHVMRQQPRLADIKVAILTSRSSEKHKQYARELGVKAYLVKPCEHDVLLQTVRELIGG